jgi:hypothetical protein
VSAPLDAELLGDGAAEIARHQDGAEGSRAGKVIKLRAGERQRAKSAPKSQNCMTRYGKTPTPNAWRLISFARW